MTKETTYPWKSRRYLSDEAERGRANWARHRQAMENGRMNEERAEGEEDQQ